MKIVLIGGSSPSTPTLIDWLAAYRPLPPLEIILLSRSETSLEPVARAARLLVGDRPISISVIPTTDYRWAESLDNADIIVLQLRIGGYEARQQDESFPLEVGICGDQELGPGGLANAWRSWPVVKSYITEAAARAPQSLFLVLSSPVGLLVRLGLLSAPHLNIVGICELPWSTMLQICCGNGISYSDISFSYVGLHHFGWFYHFESQSRDFVKEYQISGGAIPEFPSAALVQRFSAIPTRYARLHCDPVAAIAMQKLDLGKRVRYLTGHRQNALQVFSRGDINEIKTVLKQRAAPWYSEAIGPLVAAVAGAKVMQPFFLSRPNQAIVEELHEDDIVELAHYITDSTIRVQPIRKPIPDKVLNAIQSFVQAERLAADAVWSTDPSILRLALRAHPWTKSKEEFHPTLAEMITKA
jgi:6-phospho-beta-glucosidase